MMHLHFTGMQAENATIGYTKKDSPPEAASVRLAPPMLETQWACLTVIQALLAAQMLRRNACQHY